MYFVQKIISYIVVVLLSSVFICSLIGIGAFCYVRDYEEMAKSVITAIGSGLIICFVIDLIYF